MPSTAFQLPVPSLERLCLIHYTGFLYNKLLGLSNPKDNRQFDYVYLVDLTRAYERAGEHKVRILNHVKQSPLPSIIKAKVFATIVELRFDSWEWDWYCSGFKMHCKVPRMTNFSKIYLTQHGKVDKSKILKEYIDGISTTIYLTSDELLFWYKVACDWCLEDSIMKLWNMMNAKERRAISMKGRNNMLMIYWINQCGDESSALHDNVCYQPRRSLFENLLDYVMLYEKKYAVMYLWHKLSDNERSRAISKCVMFAANFQMPDLLCRVFYMMTDKQCKKYLQTYPALILCCFLLFYHKQCFLASLDAVLKHLRGREYVSIVAELIRQINVHKGIDTIYDEMLHEVWSKSPTNLKCYVIKKALIPRELLVSGKSVCQLLVENGESLRPQPICGWAGVFSKRIRRYL